MVASIKATSTMVVKLIPQVSSVCHIILPPASRPPSVVLFFASSVQLCLLAIILASRNQHQHQQQQQTVSTKSGDSFPSPLCLFVVLVMWTHYTILTFSYRSPAHDKFSSKPQEKQKKKKELTKLDLSLKTLAERVSKREGLSFHLGSRSTFQWPRKRKTATTESGLNTGYWLHIHKLSLPVNSVFVLVTTEVTLKSTSIWQTALLWSKFKLIFANKVLYFTQGIVFQLAKVPSLSASFSSIGIKSFEVSHCVNSKHCVERNR